MHRGLLSTDEFSSSLCLLVHYSVYLVPSSIFLSTYSLRVKGTPMNLTEDYLSPGKRALVEDCKRRIRAGEFDGPGAGFLTEGSTTVEQLIARAVCGDEQGPGVWRIPLRSWISPATS